MFDTGTTKSFPVRGDCVPNCDGAWLQCAKEVHISNKVHPIMFAHSVRELLVLGRVKCRNVIVVHSTNWQNSY